MDFNELKSRPIEDLRLLAAKYSIKTHHRAKAETIAKLIVEHITAKPSDTLKHVAETPKAPIVIHTQEQINEVIAPFAKKEGYVVQYPGDDTVILKYKGAEESLHMSSGLRVIRMKAESVSKGARKIHMIDIGDGPVMAVG